MRKFIFNLGLILLSLFSCKKEPISLVNTNFSIEISRPDGVKTIKVGEAHQLQIKLVDFDPNNPGQIETIFFVHNEKGESNALIKTSDNTIVGVGQKYIYDYKSNQMTLNFTYTPTEDGNQDLIIEVRCQGVVRTEKVPILMRNKGVVVSAGNGGKISYLGKISTIHNLELKYGDIAEFTAVPNPRFRFIAWYLNGKEASQSPNFILRAENEINLEARFASLVYKVTPQINIPEAGKVSVVGGNQYIDDGSTASVSVSRTDEHREGYIFKGWYVNNLLVSTNDTYSFNPKGNVSPEARFEPKTFSVKYIQNPNMYSIKVDGKELISHQVQYGKSYSFEFFNLNRAAGYSFVSTSGLFVKDKTDTRYGNMIFQIGVYHPSVSDKVIGVCRGDILFKVSQAFQYTDRNGETSFFYKEIGENGTYIEVKPPRPGSGGGSRPRT